MTGTALLLASPTENSPDFEVLMQPKLSVSGRYLEAEDCLQGKKDHFAINQNSSP
jgi:hypothetical protein